MAQQYSKISEIGEYTPYHFTATQGDTIIDATHTHGTFLGHLIVGQAGTGITIKIGNGTTGTTANVLAIISPVAGGSYPFECQCPKGCYVAISGTTAGDYTIMAAAMAA